MILLYVVDGALEDLGEILQEGAALGGTRQGEIDDALSGTGLLDAMHEKLSFDLVNKLSLGKRLEVAR